MAILVLAPASSFMAAAGNNDNVTPAAPDITQINRLFVNTTNGDATFTGLVAGADGQLVWVWNQGTNLLTLANQNAGSTAANRFRGLDDILIPANGSVLIFYDASVSRWVMGV